MQNPTGRRTVYTQGSDRGMNCEMPVTKTLSWGQEDIQVCILSEADEARRGLREARDFSLGAGIGLEGIESADHMVLAPRQDFL